MGHISRGGQKYQIIDTPGLLDRPLSERNETERQAIAAMRHLKGVILFLVDPTGHCGYPLEDQLKLLSDIKRWLEMPVVVAYNKSDIQSYTGEGMKISTLTGDGVSDALDACLALVT